MKYWLTYLAILLSFTVQGQVTVSGEITLDSSWTREIYASRIPSIADLNNASNHLVFASAKVDSSGHWQLKIPNVNETHLIRLHTKKRHDPINSLIKGTQDQNFGIIALQPGVDVRYYHPDDGLFNNFNVKDELNSTLRTIDSIITGWEQIDQLTLAYDERIRVRREAAEELMFIADTSTAILPAVYALNASDFGFNRQEVIAKGGELADKFGEHPYLLPYAENEPRGFKKTVYILLIIAIIGFLVLVFGSRYLAHKREQRLHSLTPRELEVFKYAQNGKTNKEIAMLLNVESSTIKSHIKNIYKKLGISSRRDLAGFSQ